MQTKMAVNNAPVNSSVSPSLLGFHPPACILDSLTGLEFRILMAKALFESSRSYSTCACVEDVEGGIREMWAVKRRESHRADGVAVVSINLLTSSMLFLHLLGREDLKEKW